MKKRKSLSIGKTSLWVMITAVTIAGLYMSYVYTHHSTAKSVAEQTAALPRYGIAAGSSLADLSPDELDQRLADIQKLGSGWVRFDFDWSKIQPDSATTYDWAPYDQVVKAARAHNLIVLGVLDFTPAWARSEKCSDAKQCAPANKDEYAQFAAAVSNRYQSQGLHYWEIWNEPNLAEFWQPKPDASTYSGFLQSAYAAIHKQDAQAIVLSGSLAPAASDRTNIAPGDFLSTLYGRGASRYFDAVGDHPYTFPVPPSYKSDHAWTQMADGKSSLRGIMVEHGDTGKKIWITEFGAPTGGPGPEAKLGDYNLNAHPWKVSEDLQSYIFSEAFTLYRGYDWVGPMLIYSFKDAGADPSTNENFFGLVRADGSHKPAYDTVKATFSDIK